MTNLRNGLAALPAGPLGMQLAALRANIDELAQKLGDQYRGTDEPMNRAEQLSAAIQRLEWALERHRVRSRSAAVGA